ncbi:MAG: Xaa-Pro peptidase family protein [Bacteroidetes bacterium]|nr:Xaa-Pro peptidase family protein [Bacteroidota bacterium]
MSNQFIRRVAALRAAMHQSGLDSVLLNPGPSMPYLSGLHFHISERPVILCLPANGEASIIVPELEAQKLNHASFALEAFTYSEDVSSWQAAFTAGLARLASMGARRVGIEPRSLRVLELRFLEGALPQISLVSCEGAMASLRAKKDSSELDLMQEAVRMAQDALKATLPHVKVGVSEREIAGRLIANLLAEGSGGELPFQPIIAFGANSANPHAMPTDYQAKKGDLILFDWGANHQGYFSDLTRTFALGQPSEKLRLIHDTVRASNEAGRNASRPGVPAGAVDDASRKTITDAGFGEYFTHRTGHGLGLEVHEEPYMRAGNDQLLEPGMTFTVEPGIYLPGEGGVRIEDDMVITKDGARSLSTYPRELQILPA